MNIKKQSGFTLVEIAIVLVIIGLLLGGILKGQELINSARVRNMADQNSGIQAAYYGFIDRYRLVPGDMTPANACSIVGAAVDAACGGAPVVGGNQNGRIDQFEEAGAVWSHLSVAGFINGTYTGVTPDAATYAGGVNDVPVVLPGNAYNSPIFLGHTNDYDNGDAATIPTVKLSYAFGAGAPASILRELDVKLDDALPLSGIMRSTMSAASAGEAPGDDFGVAGMLLWDATATTCVTLPDQAGATWFVDSDNITCNAVVLY
jgi:prepilin-type N-terminal cleavage/methylation domain-containing protein